MYSRLSVLIKLFPELRKILQPRKAADFDEFLESHFERCVQCLEAEAHHLIPDSEEKLSAFLAARLNIPGLEVIREGYSNGHVDITIKLASTLSPEQRLAEAKIYAGPKYHFKAIEQLISRYSTGRQPVGYIIEYVKQKGIANIVARMRKQSDEDLPVRQEGVTADHSMRWTYVSQHRHSSDELVRVVHININLYRPAS